MERRSIELTPEQWLVLENLAIDTNSVAPTGPNSGCSSWRTLIKRIANGEITITYEIPTFSLHTQ
jgi:hypothetical protein